MTTSPLRPGSHLSCQSGGVHDSISVPGFSKYVLRNSCNLPGRTVTFGDPCDRLWKADKTTSAGKDTGRCRSAVAIKKKENYWLDLPGDSLSFISTKYLSSSNSLASCTWCNMGPVQYILLKWIYRVVLVQQKPLITEFYKEAINHKNKQVRAKVCQLQTF